MLQISSFETQDMVWADEDTSLVLPCWIVQPTILQNLVTTYHIIIVLANTNRGWADAFAEVVQAISLAACDSVIYYKQ